MTKINTFQLLMFCTMIMANLHSSYNTISGTDPVVSQPTAPNEPIITKDYIITNKANIPITYTCIYLSQDNQTWITKTKVLAPEESYTITISNNSQPSYTVTAENMGMTTTWQAGELTADNPQGLQSLNITTKSHLSFQPTKEGSVAQQIQSTQDQLQLMQQNLQGWNSSFDGAVENLKNNPFPIGISISQSLINNASDFLQNIPSFMTTQFTDQINQIKSSMAELQKQIITTQKNLPTLQPYLDNLDNWTQILFGWKVFSQADKASNEKTLPEISQTMENRNKALAYIQTIPADIATQLGQNLINIKDNITQFSIGSEFQPIVEVPQPTSKYIITNNSNSPANIITITFYDKDNNALNSPTEVGYNGGTIAIPENAKFIQGTYVASTLQHEVITVLDMVPLDPKNPYSLTNPNSNDKLKNSRAKWVLSPTIKISKKGKGRWKAACKHDKYCQSGNCKKGHCTKP